MCQNTAIMGFLILYGGLYEHTFNTWVVQLFLLLFIISIIIIIIISFNTLMDNQLDWCLLNLLACQMSLQTIILLRENVLQHLI